MSPRLAFVLIGLSLSAFAPADCGAGAGPAGAATAQDDTIRFGGQSSGGGDSALNGGWIKSTAVALALVVALILGGAWLVRRFGGGSAGLSRSGAFQLKGRWHLGSRQYVTLVRFGRRMLLLGVTGQQINLLADVSEPGEVEHLLHLLPGTHRPAGPGFGQLLGGQSRRMEQAMSDEGADSPTAAASGQVGRLLGRIKSRLAQFRSKGD